MDRAYLLYCRIGAVVFAINTIYPVTTKFLQERLADDWLHSVLHLCSALFGIYAGWYASNSTPAAPPRSQAPSISSVRKRSPGGWGFADLRVRHHPSQICSKVGSGTPTVGTPGERS